MGQKKENEAIKGRIIRDIMSLLGHEKEDYYKPVRVGSFWCISYIEYENNGNKNKKLSIEETFN